MMKQNNLLIGIVLIPYFALAQPSKTDSTSVNKKRLRLFTISAGVFYTGSIATLSNVWYSKSDHQSFKFFNDFDEWKQLDKVGHFYSAFHISNATSHALQWANIKKKKADLISSATAMLLLAPIEILDGYSDAYGASLGDLIANTGGATFYLAQSYLWNEIRIWPKFSFHKTNYAALHPDLLGNTFTSQILKDYNGQTYWMCFDMDKFIRFPKWLNLAVGYGAQEMVYARDQQNIINGYTPYRQYYLSIDFDVTAIKTKSKAVKRLLFFVNMIKLPAPALEVSKNGLHFSALYF